MDGLNTFRVQYTRPDGTRTTIAVITALSQGDFLAAMTANKEPLMKRQEDQLLDFVHSMLTEEDITPWIKVTFLHPNGSKVDREKKVETPPKDSPFKSVRGAPWLKATEAE